MNESCLVGGDNESVNCRTPMKGWRGTGGSPAKSTPPQKLKSPSDTMIYAPVMRMQKDNNEMIEKISNFVEAIRFEQQEGVRSSGAKDASQPGTSSQQPISKVC